MKTLLSLIVLLSICTMVHSESARVEIEIRLTHDGELVAAPKIAQACACVASGTVSVVREWMAPTGRTLPIGIILDYSVALRDGKIRYDCLLTIRENQKNVGSFRPHGVSSFRTQEFMLWGLAESGKEFKADLGDKTTIAIILTRVAPDALSK